jgi:DNA-binding transcriptional regulator YdaS (Cro superfamily)
MMKTRKSPIDAILGQQRATIFAVVQQAGSQQALADQLGVSQAAISKWLLRGWMPLERAAEVEALFGVSRATVAHPRITAHFATADEMFAAET